MDRIWGPVRLHLAGALAMAGNIHSSNLQNPKVDFTFIHITLNEKNLIYLQKCFF
jgi:hypothetical protein